MATRTAVDRSVTSQKALQTARAYWEESSEVKKATGKQCLPVVVHAAGAVAASLRSGGKLLICGNGGSAADSQHLAGEFVSVLDRTFMRPALAAIALTTDTSIITAIANDFGYSGIFKRQVEALGRPGDVLLAISTSGNSECVVQAVECARNLKMSTIALTGAGGGKLSTLADIVVCVPCSSVQHTQEMHLAIEHMLTALVEQELFGEQPNEQ